MLDNPNIQIGNEAKKFILEFRASNRDIAPRKSIELSEKQAAVIRDFLHSSGKFIDIQDKKGNYVETLDKKEIKGIKRIGAKPDEVENEGDRLMACEYGTRHPHKGAEGFAECNCQERFNGVPSMTFSSILQDRHPSVRYPSDIIPGIQKDMERVCKGLNPKQSYIPKCRKKYFEESTGKSKGFERVSSILPRVIENLKQ